MSRISRTASRFIVLIAATVLLSACANHAPSVKQEKVTRIEHDMVSDVVIITDTKYHNSNPVVDIYIANPHNYQLNVYEIKGGSE